MCIRDRYRTLLCRLRGLLLRGPVDEDVYKRQVEDNKLHVCHWFTVDDLNFLKRGGRVSAATALVGTMLSIKPVMHTDNEGRLTMVGKARGRKASLKALLDAIERLVIEPEKQTMFICHADCEEEAKQVAAEIQRRFGTTDIRIHYIGPVIGSHTGPNTMGLFLSLIHI